MTKLNPYTLIGWLGMITVPLAPAFFFGWRVYTAVSDTTQNIAWLSIPVAIASAVGLEIVGIIAGHVGMAYHQRSDRRWLLAVAIMLTYVAIGVYELRGTIGMVMFLIAPLVYVLVALNHGLETAVSIDTATAAAELEFDHQLKLQQQADRTAIKLAKIAAENAASANPAPQQSQNPQPAPQTPQPATLYECACGRTFDKPQSYSAHRRHCAITEIKQIETAVSANGHITQEN